MKIDITRQPVLVVEDDPLLRLDMALAFSDAGFSVIEAGSADEALDILNERSGIALVVTDIEMPGKLDGLKLAEIVSDRWPETAIFVTSGKIKPAEDTPGRFFPKPYDSRIIVDEARQIAA
ncbi:response regulator [Pelagibacterium montanilacus]|uniref:response regulator n=1 Tax=Pelagibacterium montanilacus TaxID=2185280 RepID=UPI000F8ED077|nr:response regulator [Pelagibacterium montanilacus]